eukprot:g35357.t1
MQDPTDSSAPSPRESTRGEAVPERRNTNSLPKSPSDSSLDFGRFFSQSLAEWYSKEVKDVVSNRASRQTNKAEQEWTQTNQGKNGSIQTTPPKYFF